MSKKYIILFFFTNLYLLVQGQVMTPDVKDFTQGGWYCFRKEIVLDKNCKELEFHIAADTKYWLWINGELEVFEGGLKRGPNPKDTYCDVVRNCDKLRPGKNVIAVLLWYFGVDGFSHRSSPTPGLYVDLRINNQPVTSGKDWKVAKHPAYFLPTGEKPNYRLSESNVGFDARRDILFCQTDFDDRTWKKPRTISLEESGWHQLCERPIPFWRDYGLKNYVRTEKQGNSIVAHLPYNAQITPYLKVRSTGGDTIDIRTDNYLGGSVPNVYAEYVTTSGEQEYESLGWMNGHSVIYTFPEGVEVIDVKYRETGYDTDFAGNFICDDLAMNTLWNKSQRTLYVTMRDTYMDCPDRERAQWWGDVVNELGETFYALDDQSHALVRKAIRELMDWQRADSTIFAPIPAGSWDKELPMQMLASIGYYGFWTYYMGTGDKQTIEYVFQNVKKYIHIWKTDNKGLVVPRKGGWTWGDWGENKDIELLYNLWYVIALDGYEKMANLIGDQPEALWARETANKIRTVFHAAYWNGSYYISPNYKGQPDDRAQALAVVSNTAPVTCYESLRSFFNEQYHASPYMEKYVLQALCMMGYHQDAMNRMKLRYGKMIESPLTTLWEGWGIGTEGYGGGSYNHAWSGGALTIMSQYIAGIETITPRFESFRVKPMLGNLNFIKADVPLSDHRKIRLEVYKKKDKYRLELEVPLGTKALLYLPEEYNTFWLNGVFLSSEGVSELQPGKWIVDAECR